MEKRVASAFFLGLFSLIFPVFLILEFFYSYVWLKLIFSVGQEVRDGPIQAFWVKPCEKIINWGWKEKTSQKNIARVVRFDSSQISINDRVRIVTMNGCMGHVRENVREGVVIGFEIKQVYGTDNRKYRYAKIQLDNGEIIERCAESRLWSVNERLPEYQE